jgi:hypothetical protein
MNTVSPPRMASLGLVAILFVSFITLSGWQSVDSNSRSAQDTTKKSTKKSAGYSKTTIITIDENGVPHEQIIENYDGDEGLRKLMLPGQDFDFVMPNIPDFRGFGMPDLPEFHFPPMPDFHLDLDSLDDFGFRFNSEDFEGFSEDMEALMKERFEAFGPQFEESMKRMEEELSRMDLDMNLQFDGLGKDWEDDMERLGENLERDLGHLDLNLKGLDENLKNLGDGIKAFENEAREELITDGYLKAGEKIETMEWSDDTIKFNGKTIKTEHVEKYRKLKERHFKHQLHRGRPE